jgi:hypothetical protein
LVDADRQPGRESEGEMQMQTAGVAVVRPDHPPTHLSRVEGELEEALVLPVRVQVFGVVLADDGEAAREVDAAFADVEQPAVRAVGAQLPMVVATELDLGQQPPRPRSRFALRFVHG